MLVDAQGSTLFPKKARTSIYPGNCEMCKEKRRKSAARAHMLVAAGSRLSRLRTIADDQRGDPSGRRAEKTAVFQE
jgi:hypothetical protein